MSYSIEFSSERNYFSVFSRKFEVLQSLCKARNLFFLDILIVHYIVLKMSCYHPVINIDLTNMFVLCFRMGVPGCEPLGLGQQLSRMALRAGVP